jgi:GNAT superfamily N-acetyltransferase
MSMRLGALLLAVVGDRPSFLPPRRCLGRALAPVGAICYSRARVYNRKAPIHGLGGELVFVDQAAEPVAAVDPVEREAVARVVFPGWWRRVAPRARGAGVGRALMKAAENYARSLRLASVTLNTWVFNTGAHDFYERLGYERLNMTMRRRLRSGPHSYLAPVCDPFRPGLTPQRTVKCRVTERTARRTGRRAPILRTSPAR